MTSSTDLAALLCSRLCHDMLSPVGALSNGLELLADESDPDMRQRCFELLEQSARISADKLKFFRLAYGAAGGFGEGVPVEEPRELVQALVAANDRLALEWGVSEALLPKPAVKVLLNLAAIGIDSLVRGGTLSVGAEARDGATEIAVRAAGPRLAFDQAIGKALDGSLAEDELSGRTAPAHMIRLLAEQHGGGVQMRFRQMLWLWARSCPMHDGLVHRSEPSPNWDERALPVSMVVLHYTEMESADAALAKLIDPDSKVSAHYLISEAGEVIALVPEDKRAWHAGVSYWRGHRDVNSASIGIELDHPGHLLGYRDFSEAQFEALVPLLHRIVAAHDIPRANVIGHSDVAPARKIDPGELFPWDRLAEYRLCLPRPEKLELGDPFDNDGAFYLALERYGYDITDGHKAVEAFQRRWRPERIDGEIDGQVRAILFQLLLDRDAGKTR